MKTISIPDELHEELSILRIKEKNKTAAELINKLLIEYQKNKFYEASNLFSRKINEKKINFQSFLKNSRKIREEISDEWFSD